MLEANDNTVLKMEEIKDFLAALKPETRICTIQDLIAARNDIAQDLLPPGLPQDQVTKLVEQDRIMRLMLIRANEVQLEWLQMTPQPPIKPPTEGF